MDLRLDAKDVAILHAVVERYLNQVRDAAGHGARGILAEEEAALQRILADLHAMKNASAA
jgi:hypothetical protein